VNEIIAGSGHHAFVKQYTVTSLSIKGETKTLSIGPLIAVCCQATIKVSNGTTVALAPSELVGVAERRERG
jgi:hypothetical protein